jgi:murein DD-endopeptidase MepM/ murein hydrolase activator NlpD
MEIENTWRRGIARAVAIVLLAGFVGACVDQSIPAPVYMRSAEPAPVPTPPPPAPRQIVVQHGQSLGGIAHAFHVPKATIIAANHLQPPYELKAGAHLIIPSADGPMQRPTAMAAAAPTAVSAAPLAPPQTLTPAQTPAAAPQAAQPQPQIIPLDGPAPKQTSAVAPPAAAPPPVLPPRNAAAALPLPGENPGPQVNAASGQDETGGRFPWPVRGRVLASYGSTTAGGRNDGINIGAPRGTPVHAIDGGTVAYAGNEVKGYGNIVLIKHANGWISAYAHLDDMAVKSGDTIAPGQVIARVGDTGGVTEPQLHFELRRGKKPVDPREFLAPAPSAEAPAGNRPG